MTRPDPTSHQAADKAASEFKGADMAAKVYVTTGPLKFQAWCDECQDGYNGSRVPAEDWQSLHNRLKHAISQEGK